MGAVMVSAGAGRDEGGFSLLETIVAMAILATGLLSLAGVFALGMAHLTASSARLLAREKAREAIESVHTARDMRVLPWSQIQNQWAGGVFLDGPQPLATAGPDGLVNTADDGALETLLNPGADNILGTADDVEMPLTGYSREIAISPAVIGGVTYANMRQITVTIRFKAGGIPPYVLTTYISAVS